MGVSVAFAVFLLACNVFAVGEDCYKTGARCSQFFLNGVCYLADFSNNFYRLNESSTYTCITGKPPLDSAKPLIEPIAPQVTQSYDQAAKTKKPFRLAKQKHFVALNDTNGKMDLAAVKKDKNGDASILTAQGDSTSKQGSVRYNPTTIPIGRLDEPTTTPDTCQQNRFPKVDHVYVNNTRCEDMYDENYLKSCILQFFCDFKMSDCDAESCVRQYYHLKDYNSAAYRRVDDLRKQLESPSDSKTLDYYSLCKKPEQSPNAKTKITQSSAALAAKPKNAALAAKYCEAVKELDERVYYQVRSPEKETSCMRPTIYNFHEDIQYLFQVYEGRRQYCYHYEKCNGGPCEDETIKAGRKL